MQFYATKTWDELPVNIDYIYCTHDHLGITAVYHVI